MSDDAQHQRHCPHCKTCFDSEERDRATVIDQDGHS
jgi:hypothetical protein